MPDRGALGSILEVDKRPYWDGNTMCWHNGTRIVNFEYVGNFDLNREGTYPRALRLTLVDGAIVITDLRVYRM
jgi:hypothetical protein